MPLPFDQVSKMIMDGEHQIFIFGDQTYDCLPGLQGFVLNKDVPYLVSFIQRVHSHLRRDIASLPALEQRLFPPFADIQELLVKVKNGKRNTVIDGILVCFHHLCSLIRYENWNIEPIPLAGPLVLKMTSYYGQPGRVYRMSGSTFATGLCIGALAAAALSCSRSIADLSDSGVDAVRIAMRTGLRAYRAASAIRGEPEEGLPDAPWAVILPDACILNSDINEAVKSFIENRVSNESSSKRDR